jgi:hypothetical protein
VKGVSLAREHTPAWVNVTTNEYAPYMMEGGLLAVRDLTMGAIRRTGIKKTTTIRQV